MDLDFAALALGVAGVVSAVAVSFADQLGRRLRRIREGSREADSLAEKIVETSALLAKAATATAELDDELVARMQAVAKLEQDAAQAEAIAKLHEEQVEAVETLFKNEFASSRRRTFWQTVTISAVSFLLGVGATWLITG